LSGREGKKLLSSSLKGGHKIKGEKEDHLMEGGGKNLPSQTFKIEITKLSRGGKRKKEGKKDWDGLYHMGEETGGRKGNDFLSGTKRNSIDTHRGGKGRVVCPYLLRRGGKKGKKEGEKVDYDSR